jgi:hypothetical protein
MRSTAGSSAGAAGRRATFSSAEAVRADLRRSAQKLASATGVKSVENRKTAAVEAAVSRRTGFFRTGWMMGGSLLVTYLDTKRKS